MQGRRPMRPPTTSTELHVRARRKRAPIPGPSPPIRDGRWCLGSRRQRSQRWTELLQGRFAISIRGNAREGGVMTMRNRAAAMAVVALAVALSFGAARAQTTCQPTQTNQNLTLPDVPLTPKPALYATFIDTLYGTCFRRISDDAMHPSDSHNPAPVYSQLQPWNSDQTLLYLATGDLLYSPSYSYFKRIPSLGGVNFRWSPIYPTRGYYSNGNSFRQIDVMTEVITTLHTFAEYPGGLEKGNEWEELSADGRFVVLEGYRLPVQKDTLQVSAISMTNGSAVITSAGKFGEVLDRMPV